MHRLPTSRAAALAAAIALAAGSILPATADEPLLRYLPGESTNALAVVRLAQIRNAGNGGLPGAEAIPSSVERLVVGSHVRLGARERVSTVAVAELETGTSPGEILTERGGPAERIGVYTAGLTPRGDYLVILAPRLIALLRPGVRQEVAHWVATLGPNGSRISPYLKEAATRPEPIVLALDLRDALAAPRVAHWLETLPADALPGTDRKQLAALLPRLVGVTLAVTPAAQTAAVVRARFDGPVQAKAEELRAAFGELLRASEASFPDLDAAAPSVEGQEFVLKASLSEDGLRRVFSLLLAPPAAEPKAAARPEPETAAAADPAPSQKYFAAVDGVVKDLERARNRATDYARTAVWHDNFARKIEDLPTAGVDKSLVDYGLRTASRMRALAASLRGQAVEVNAEQRSVTYDFKVDPGFVGYNVWGGVGYSPSTWEASSNLADVREKQAEAMAAGARAREQIWQLMTDDRAAVAREMTDKFGTPFGGTRR